MAISRKLCKGEPNGKKCRRWEDVNSEGYCPKCRNDPLMTRKTFDDLEDRCGMCPQQPKNVDVDSETNSEPDIVIQCDLFTESTLHVLDQVIILTM